MLSGRNYIAEEYYKAESYLQDKKFKRMMLDKSLWELDEEMLKANGVEKDQALSNPDVARRFMFTDVRSQGDSQDEEVR